MRVLLQSSTATDRRQDGVPTWKSFVFLTTLLDLPIHCVLSAGNGAIEQHGGSWLASKGEGEGDWSAQRSPYRRSSCAGSMSWLGLGQALRQRRGMVQVKKAEVREAILDAAAALFEEKSYAGTSASEIGQRAGVAPSAI